MIQIFIVMRRFLMFSVLVLNFIIFSACSNPEVVQATFPGTCYDGIQNGTETGVDCGGDCAPCEENASDGYIASENYGDYQLIFQEDFETEISNTWNYDLEDGCPNLCGWGNNEMQYFTEKNASLSNGKLVIQAELNNIFDHKIYTSSRLNTKDQFKFKFGRVDIRAKMPSAKGTWVALWMLNKNYDKNDPAKYWPSGGEIDIAEFLPEKPDEVMGTAHYGKDVSNHKYTSGFYNTKEFSFTEQFNVFSIVWDEDSIKWLVNDQEYHSISRDSLNIDNYPFNDDFYLVLSLSVGGNLPNAVPDENAFPTSLVVDYIKVFQK